MKEMLNVWFEKCIFQPPKIVTICHNLENKFSKIRYRASRFRSSCASRPSRLTQSCPNATRRPRLHDLSWISNSPTRWKACQNEDRVSFLLTQNQDSPDTARRRLSFETCIQTRWHVSWYGNSMRATAEVFRLRACSTRTRSKQYRELHEDRYDNQITLHKRKEIQIYSGWPKRPAQSFCFRIKM